MRAPVAAAWKSDSSRSSAATPVPSDVGGFDSSTNHIDADSASVAGMTWSDCAYGRTVAARMATMVATSTRFIETSAFGVRACVTRESYRGSRERNRPLSQIILQSAEICNQEYAAPTMIFLIRMYGDPCEMLLVCVGCPFASPPVPNIRHELWSPMASRFAQKSVVIAL